MINLPGAGKAHENLCRDGHPTEFPRYPGEIEYHVHLRGPFGDTVWIEVMADSLQSAENQARHIAESRDLIPIAPFENDFIEVIKVRAYD